MIVEHVHLTVKPNQSQEYEQAILDKTETKTLEEAINKLDLQRKNIADK